MTISLLTECHRENHKDKNETHQRIIQITDIAEHQGNKFELLPTQRGAPIGTTALYDILDTNTHIV